MLPTLRRFAITTPCSTRPVLVLLVLLVLLAFLALLVAEYTFTSKRAWRSHIRAGQLDI